MARFTYYRLKQSVAKFTTWIGYDAKYPRHSTNTWIHLAYIYADCNTRYKVSRVPARQRTIHRLIFLRTRHTSHAAKKSDKDGSWRSRQLYRVSDTLVKLTRNLQQTVAHDLLHMDYGSINQCHSLHGWLGVVELGRWSIVLWQFHIVNCWHIG